MLAALALVSHARFSAGFSGAAGGRGRTGWTARPRARDCAVRRWVGISCREAREGLVLRPDSFGRVGEVRQRGRRWRLSSRLAEEADLQRLDEALVDCAGVVSMVGTTTRVCDVRGMPLEKSIRGQQRRGCDAAQAHGSSRRRRQLAGAEQQEEQRERSRRRASGAARYAAWRAGPAWTGRERRRRSRVEASGGTGGSRVRTDRRRAADGGGLRQPRPAPVDEVVAEVRGPVLMVVWSGRAACSRPGRPAERATSVSGAGRARPWLSIDVTVAVARREVHQRVTPGGIRRRVRSMPGSAPRRSRASRRRRGTAGCRWCG